MEEIASVFWVDLWFRLRSRKRVHCRVPVGWLAPILFLFLLYMFYMYLTCYTCSWLPCVRGWFSARSLGRGPGYAWDPSKT